MFKLLKRFLREEDGQDFAEYALILGAIGVASGLLIMNTVGATPADLLTTVEYVTPTGLADYRVVADIQNQTVTVLVVRIGHRREVYR